MVDKKKLDAEELEKRTAPFGTIYDQTDEPAEPTGDSGGGGSVEPEPEPADQPGNSDDHRARLWKKSL